MSSIAITASTPRFIAPAARITRRGRVLLTLVLMASLMAFGMFVGHAATASAGQRVAVRHVTVRPGETLWALAERVAPQTDPRITVARLAELNHLVGDQVDAGQRLIVSGLS